MALQIPQVQAYGHIVQLWAWAAQFGPTGQLNGHDAADIAIGSGVERDPEKYVEALIACRILDKEGDHYSIHDWYEHQGKLIERMEDGKKRWKEHRDRKKSTVPHRESVHDGVHDEVADGVLCSVPVQVTNETNETNDTKHKEKRSSTSTLSPGEPQSVSSPSKGKTKESIEHIGSIVPELLPIMQDLLGHGITGGQIKELEALKLPLKEAQDALELWRDKRTRIKWDNPAAVLYTMLRDRATLGANHGRL